jgi:hypothetical protein
LEEAFVGGAEVVEAWFAVRGLDEAVFGALAVAGEADIAAAAVGGEGVGFVGAELALLWGGDHVAEVLVHDVAEFEVGVDVVVAGVEVAVVFEGDGVATVFGEDAEAAALADPVAEGDVEELDVGAADIVADPVVVDADEEVAVVVGADAPGGDGGGGGAGDAEVEAEAAGLGVGGALDEGDELEEAGADGFEEVVDLEGVAGVEAVDDGEGVEVDVVVFQDVEAGHDAVEGGGAAFVDAVGVVEFAWAVDAEADEEVVGGEESAPVVVESGAVGLEGVVDGSAVRVLALEGDDFFEEGDAEEGWFAALPGEGHAGAGLGGDVVADEGLEDVVRHAEVLAFWEEVFFFEVEAVFAVEVADRADGLGHGVEWPGVAGGWACVGGGHGWGGGQGRPWAMWAGSSRRWRGAVRRGGGGAPSGPTVTAATTEALGSGEEAHRRWPKGRSEQGASKAKHRPPRVGKNGLQWWGVDLMWLGLRRSLATSKKPWRERFWFAFVLRRLSTGRRCPLLPC